MAELEVPKGVSKVTLGGVTVWQNNDGWVPLKLAEGVGGTAMIRNLKDGTAELMGAIGYLGSYSGNNSIYAGGSSLIVAPDGYKFADHNWHVSANDDSPMATVYTSYIYGSNAATSRGNGRVSFEGGNISIDKVGMSGPLQGDKVRILFPLSKNNVDYTATNTNFYEPAIVGFEKV